MGPAADMYLQVEYRLCCTGQQLEILMAALARSAATLRIGGDDLDPVEMSRLLGGTPSVARLLPIKDSPNATSSGFLKAPLFRV
jgi:hypothetical protein